MGNRGGDDAVSHSRSSLIYEFYKSHIQFGYYHKGEFIPSIEQLCACYQVAPLTVRKDRKSVV